MACDSRAFPVSAAAAPVRFRWSTLMLVISSALAIFVTFAHKKIIKVFTRAADHMPKSFMAAKIFNMPGKIRILWIGGDRAEASTLDDMSSYSVESATDVTEGLDRLEASGADVLLARFPLPGWTQDGFLDHVERIATSLPVIILTESLKPMELGQRVQSAVEGRSRPPKPVAPWKHLLVGESRAMDEIDRIIRLVGPRRCTVLITGETGTGKEMAARAIHMASPRAAHPMVAVNCSALPENLLEAELFGHVRGAFTGAVQQRTGRFEQAHNSTLFLDEIGEMPLELQAKLLRVLQERELQRLGSSETIQVDVRVIAASNLDLEERVRQGKFREDLFYRVNVVPIAMPPLRRRTTDLPMLVCHFIDKICRQEQMPLKRVNPESLDRLSSYAWPGNVRQLENAVEMAIVLSGERLTLYPGDFPLPASSERAPVTGPFAAVPFPDDGLDFEQTVSHIERSILEQALRRTRGNKKMAADMLRLKRTTLAAKLRSLDAAV
jgi:DNA-binding NtrC family response regulator